MAWYIFFLFSHHGEELFQTELRCPNETESQILFVVCLSPTLDLPSSNSSGHISNPIPLRQESYRTWMCVVQTTWATSLNLASSENVNRQCLTNRHLKSCLSAWIKNKQFLWATLALRILLERRRWAPKSSRTGQFFGSVGGFSGLQTIAFDRGGTLTGHHAHRRRFQKTNTTIGINEWLSLGHVNFPRTR